MTTGIYALYWDEQDLIYIGQSVNIEKRYREHLRTLIEGTHSNYKVQSTFNLKGRPSLHILERCASSSLNDLEILWTEEFDSINNGLNIVEAGQSGYGTNSNNSKYTKLQILKVFRHLYLQSYKHLTSKDISIRTSVGLSMVEHIKIQHRHVWLKEEYPYQYTKMIHIDRRHNSLIPGGSWLKSPEGVVVHILNLREFARENNLNSSHLSGLVSGKRNSHKGWVLFRPY